MAGKKRERKFKVGDGVWVLTVVFGSGRNRKPAKYVQRKPRVAGIIERIWGDNYHVRRTLRGRESVQRLWEVMLAPMTHAEYRRKFFRTDEPPKAKATSAGK
jgi:hypothetical protein